jgi:1,4-alpha-glucan branching enzyme
MAKTIKSKCKETFCIAAPGAMSVQLAGDFTHWEQNPVPLKKEANGVWRAIVDMAPGTHHYRFLVDGQWQDDPDCALRVPNPYGSADMVRQVG